MDHPIRVSPRGTNVAETPGAQTLRRGLSILKLLARHQPTGLRISEIGRRLELNKATAVRLTQALVDERFVVRDAASRCYRLGPETFAIGLAAEPGYVLQRLATASLRALALETGDWVFFSVVEGFEAICISRETGDMPIPSDALRLGDRHPLGVGAGGLALLASLSDDEVDKALTANGRYIEEHFPNSSVPVIRRLLGETRERGYSVIPGIVAPGYWALGVPLCSLTVGRWPRSCWCPQKPACTPRAAACWARACCGSRAT
jgi:DNA-binding IclR family transcriptional regulator